MKLKSILENKVSQFKQGTQEHEVVGWLNHKADEIIQLTSRHLKHVPNVFDEFDVHDAEHSENVLSIIENLLGDEAENLSSYDLFSLIAVSYLHDCGMAVSDYEMKVMDLAEKEEFDGIKSKPSEAKEAIIRYKKDICGKRSADFEGEIRNWLFVPEKKDDLIDYFAKLFLDYQDYRNGKREEIKKSDDMEQTNRDERLSYLRLTHHERVEKYIKNWGTSIFKNFPGGNGQKLADTIAQCCLAHGKSMSYIENDLKELTDVMYYGSEASNLQFISIMLRLGDLIDYSCKRAHPILRALHQFKSDFSFDQWRIKDENALSFSVKNGKVACVANCKTPRDYYKICDYVSQIDEELESYIKLNKENKWNDYPKSISESVNRKNLSLDDRYDPVPGLRFVLDQKNVLKLLTGANLYPNKYACLRELYQNSLDACRCQIAKDRAVGKSLDGKILFGLGEEEGRKFVYCLDNGKGMSKDIIQKYVLHIGTSYYSSQEFSKEKVKNKADFKPTSQFGIGLLSCFMIGDEIVITTLEEGGELISCGIDEPNECFYYINKPSDFDKELVSQYSSGTLVKIFLNDKYQDLLNDDPLESLGYLLWFDESEYLYNDNLKENVKKDIDRWNHHLYNIMNDFIIVVPDGIEVNIELQNIEGGKKPIMIYHKPLPIIKELQPYAIINSEVHDRDKSAFDEFKKRDHLDIHVKSECLEFRTIIELGKRDKSRIGLNGANRCSVDGIGIGKIFYSDISFFEYLFRKEVCVFNFIGENRPQLSVSRDKLMDTSLSEYEDDARILIEKLIKKSIEQVCKYIKDKAILPVNPLYQIIWNRLSDKYSMYSQLFYRCLTADANCYDMQLPFTKIEMTFGELLKEDELIINKSMLNEALAWRFVIPRLLGSECVELMDNNIIAKGHVEFPKAVDMMSLVSNYLLFHPIDFNKCWNEYDIVAYSEDIIFISDNLWKNIRRDISDYVDESEDVIKDCWAYTEKCNDIFWFFNTLSFRIDAIKMDSTKEIFIIALYRIIEKQLYNNLEEVKGVDCLGLMIYVQDFSVLAFSKMKSVADDEIDNEASICFARRGKCSRQELLDSITVEWKDKIKNVLFPDGTIWNPDSSN